jgi:hypothetical protein
MTMDTTHCIRKAWIKPAVHILNIKKDTFSGSTAGGAEGQGKIPHPPKNPTPR